MPGRRKSQLVSRSKTTRRRAAPFSQSLLAHNRQLLWISGFSPMDWLRKEERGADQGLGYEQSKVTKWVKSKRERSFHPRFEHLISAVGQIDCDESSVAVELNPAVFLYEGSFPHSPQFEIVDRKLQPFVSDFPTDSAGIKTFLRAGHGSPTSYSTTSFVEEVSRSSRSNFVTLARSTA